MLMFNLRLLKYKITHDKKFLYQKQYCAKLNYRKHIGESFKNSVELLSYRYITKIIM